MTTVLLDTHATIWWLGDRSQQTPEAPEAIADTDNDARPARAPVPYPVAATMAA